MFQQKKSKVVVLVILLFLLFVSYGELENSSSPKDCLVTKCKDFAEKNSVQTIGVSLILDNYTLSTTESNLKSNSIKFIRDQEALVIEIPQFKPEKSNFRYAFKMDKQFYKVNILIEKSQNVYIEIDDKIAYTHRYQMPVFQINPMHPYSLINVSFKSILIDKSLLYPQARHHHSLVFMIVILSIIAISILIYTGFTTSGEEVVNDYPNLRKNYVFLFLVSLFWLTALTLYVVGEFDAVGARNPGPFGPIGAAFSDFFQISQVGGFSKPYDLGAVNYPATSVVLLKFLNYAFPGVWAFIFTMGVFFGALYLLPVKRGLKTEDKKYIFILMFSFYPLLFGFVRGNLDLLASLLVFYSIFLVGKVKSIIPVFLLGFAIALKIWPAVFILYFVRMKRIRDSFYVVCVFFLLSITSICILGYLDLTSILKSFGAPFVSLDQISTQSFKYSYSLSSLIFFLHVLIYGGLTPSSEIIQQAAVFTDGPLAKVLVAIAALTLIKLVFLSRSKSQIFLFLCGFALLISTPTYTYRATILLGYYVLFSHAVSFFRKENRRLSRKLRMVQTFFWVPIFAPTTWYFAKDSELSIASVIQPGALIVILGIEAILLSRERRSFTKPEVMS
jgi:hypothetical protein